MKKKLLAVTLAFGMMLLVPHSALAEEANQNQSYLGTSAEEEVIPVHGYLGPDSHVVDPGGDEEETEIYVEIPTKVVFAAFESDAGEVVSPRYTITNLSAISDLKIEIESFTQKNESNASLNGQLTLKILTHEGNTLLADLFPAEYPARKLLCERLPKAVDGSQENKLGFMLGGNWSGNFKQEIQPIFDMVVKFSIAK